MTENNKLMKIFKSIKFRIVLIITFTILINTKVTDLIFNFIDNMNLYDPSISIYINMLLQLIVINGIILFFINNIVLKPLSEHMKKIKAMSEGDFTKTEDIKGTGQFKKLNDVTNKTMEILSVFAKDLQNDSTHSESISNKLKNQLDALRKSIDEISESMDFVASGSDQQNHYIAEAKEKINALDDLIVTLSQMGDRTSKISEHAIEVVSDGRNRMNNSITKIEVIEDESQMVARQMSELKDYSNKISEIIDVISQISEQTNLLALNAAIEASRAGEHGRGFSVVADEIRELAEDSQGSAEKISQLITTIQEKINDTVNSVDETIVAVTEGKSAIKDTEAVFDQIVESMNDTKENIKDIDEYSNIQSKNSNELLEIFNELSTISDQNASYSQEVAAATEEESRMVEELSELSEESNALSNDLKEKLNKFKVN